jgi:DNA polymerase I-like protein with 3'-5' exonuclease and polymerase domains
MRFIVNKQCTLDEALALIQQSRNKVAVDIETVSLENTLPLGIGIAISPDIGFYFFDVRDELAHLMIESVKTVIFQNIKFDLPILWLLGYRVGWKLENWEDTLQIAHSAGILKASLPILSQELLLKECPSVTSLWRKANQGNVAIDHVKLGQICITHACLTYELEGKLPKTSLYHLIDKPCLPLLMEMEKWGVLIDQYALTRVEQAVMNQVTPLEAELKQELSIENLASNPQVAEALKKLNIIGTRKTKSAKDSVSEESLKPLNLPLTNKLLHWRSLMKNLTTYIPAFRNVDAQGRVHTVFGNTNTGRWRSGDKDQNKPNLQNITNDSKFLPIDLDNS